MKCIGGKCNLCHQHDFRESYYYCELNGMGFRKDSCSKIECELDEEFLILEKKFNKLKQAKETVVLNQI